MLTRISHLRKLSCRFHQYAFLATEIITTSEPPYADVPRPPRNKSERKPYQTPMKTLISRAKEEKEARKLQPCKLLEHPPDNGLLVPNLIDVAHRVFSAKDTLFRGIEKLRRVVSVQSCSCCFESHVGLAGHEIRSCMGKDCGLRYGKHVWKNGSIHDVIFLPKSYHLYDRVRKPRVSHDQRYAVSRLPAIIELCIQAGLEHPKYLTKRRTKPVFSFNGVIYEFDSVVKTTRDDGSTVLVSPSPQFYDLRETRRIKQYVKDRDLKELSMRTMSSWFEMISGVKEIMKKYSVLTCGYCSEVQVGPKGHKVRSCKGAKNNTRGGLHAWQEATIDDIVHPKYVWHVRDTNDSALDNELKRYYGKAPAIVELCVQAGADIPDEYRSMMRLDVVPPDRDEVDIAA